MGVAGWGAPATARPARPPPPPPLPPPPLVPVCIICTTNAWIYAWQIIKYYSYVQRDNIEVRLIHTVLSVNVRIACLSIIINIGTHFIVPDRAVLL